MILLFKPAELLYRGVNRARRAIYRSGVLKSRSLPRPVVSIGNIALGGSGKTPLVIHVARFLTGRGMRVAVLTRGFGRAGRQEGLVTGLDAREFGDEPVLIKKSADNIDVIVGLHRYVNAVEYLKSKSCDIFMLDDGFQHLPVARDADIVIDAPAAKWLREGRGALRDADIVLVRDRDFRLRLANVEPLRSRRLFAFAALADNAQFFASLRQEGLDLAATLGFRDHHLYTAADIAIIREAAKRAGAETIVTTEKDAVKIPSETDIVAVRAEVVLEREAELFERLLSLLKR
jgi:tetraacyldisaccharide 4'-kinase